MRWFVTDPNNPKLNSRRLGWIVLFMGGIACVLAALFAISSINTDEAFFAHRKLAFVRSYLGFALLLLPCGAYLVYRSRRKNV